MATLRRTSPQIFDGYKPTKVPVKSRLPKKAKALDPMSMTGEQFLLHYDLAPVSVFRPLNEAEIVAIGTVRSKTAPEPLSILHKLLIDGNDEYGGYKDKISISVCYTRIAEFTICIIIITIEEKKILFSGVSRRSQEDTPNVIKGELLAFTRALRANKLRGIDIS